jgi:hypothetical protein
MRCRRNSRLPPPRAAGVRADMVISCLGMPHHTRLLPHTFGLVRVATSKTRADSTQDEVVLVTNRVDLTPEVVVLAYRYRWSVEVCQTQPVKMTWYPLRRASRTINDLRGPLKREYVGDIHLLSRHHDFADQAVSHRLALFKRESVQIVTQQPPKGFGMRHDLLPMPRPLLRTR